jgi:hypothetical protein
MGVREGALADVCDGGGGDANGGAESGFARYLTMIALRITAAHDLLAGSGSLWIHLDHHAAHYVKVMADVIFGGQEHFLNEVVWQYKSGGATKKRFSRKHDTLLLYAKDVKKHKFFPLSEKSYNRERKPYKFKGVKEYRDKGGWYTLVNMKDVWQIDMVGRTSAERTGYATQKPAALLERIVSSCTSHGDFCVDMFGGSGTLAAVCAEAGRRWMSIDVNRLASLYTEKRIARIGAAFDILDGSVTVAEAPQESWYRSWVLIAGREPSSDGREDIVRVSLASYSVPVDILDQLPDYAEILSDAAGLCPEQFAAGIAVDMDYDGTVFRPCHAVYGADGLTVLVSAKCRAIAIRVIDIFGIAEIHEAVWGGAP